MSCRCPPPANKAVMPLAPRMLFAKTPIAGRPSLALAQLPLLSRASFASCAGRQHQIVEPDLGSDALREPAEPAAGRPRERRTRRRRCARRAALPSDGSQHDFVELPPDRGGTALLPRSIARPAASSAAGERHRPAPACEQCCPAAGRVRFRDLEAQHTPRAGAAQRERALGAQPQERCCAAAPTKPERRRGSASRPSRPRAAELAPLTNPASRSSLRAIVASPRHRPASLVQRPQGGLPGQWGERQPTPDRAAQPGSGGSGVQHDDRSAGASFARVRAMRCWLVPRAIGISGIRGVEQTARCRAAAGRRTTRRLMKCKIPLVELEGRPGNQALRSARLRRGANSATAPAATARPSAAGVRYPQARRQS